jgi:geranylgeranyl pyrophosphate synthase
MENIKAKLDSFILNVVESVNCINDNLYRAMDYVARSGGKRVRGILLMKLCELLSVNSDDALICATALEMIHNYSLIHDDLPAMDDDDFRRGIPACHKKFGEGIAILTGNGFYTLAIQLLVEGLNGEILPSILKVIVDSSGINGILSGQAEDVRRQQPKIDSDEDIVEIINLYYLKTGKLFEAAFLIPCILSKCSPQVTEAMAESGGILGVLYQLSDDVADGHIDEDIARTFRDTLLNRFYSAIDSTRDSNLSTIKSFARQILDF